ncbi:MAG: tyrosine-type recombinase/integrase [Candidatus Kariarchaeaceae archaeon]
MSFLKYEKNSRQNTIDSYSIDLQLLFGYFQNEGIINGEERINWSKIKTSHLRGFLTYLGEERNAKSSSIHRRICTTKAFFKFLKNEEEIVDDPAFKLIYPKRKKSLPKFLTVDEVKKLLEYEKPLMHQVILEVLYATGCRCNELKEMNREDLKFYKDEKGAINGGEIMVREGKGGKDRPVMLTKRAAKILNTYLERDLSPEEQIKKEIEPAYRSRKEILNIRAEKNYAITEDTSNAILVSNRGRRIGKRTLQHIVTLYSEKTNIRSCSPHKLRHSMASHLTMGGLNIRVLQTLLGHASLDTTQIYASVTLDHIKNEYANRFPIQ